MSTLCLKNEKNMKKMKINGTKRLKIKLENKTELKLGLKSARLSTIGEKEEQI